MPEVDVEARVEGVVEVGADDAEGEASRRQVSIAASRDTKGYMLPLPLTATRLTGTVLR